MIWILAMLAVYRIAYLMTLEDGPFNAAIRWRSWLSDRFPGSWVTAGFACPLCVSFWLAAIPAVFLAQSLFMGFLSWFGVAGGVLIIHQGVKLAQRAVYYLDLLIARSYGGSHE